MLTAGPIISATLAVLTAIGCLLMGKPIASLYWLSACALNITLYLMTIVGWK